jgi:hypothetical protein
MLLRDGVLNVSDDWHCKIRSLLFSPSISAPVDMLMVDSASLLNTLEIPRNGMPRKNKHLLRKAYKTILAYHAVWSGVISNNFYLQPTAKAVGQRL